MPGCGLDVAMIKLLIVDDEPAVRKGLRMRLAAEQGFVVVGEAADGESALVLAQALQPDVVLMDLEMPHMDGIAATEALRATHACAAVILLSIYDDDATRARAAAAGATAFIPKRAEMGELLATIRQSVKRVIPNAESAGSAGKRSITNDTN